MREALDHPWVLGKAARFSHMDTTQRKLQEFNARRKLKVRLAARPGSGSGLRTRIQLADSEPPQLPSSFKFACRGKTAFGRGRRLPPTGVAHRLRVFCLCQQAAMKAVVATSRMHEGSKRRTDSCEIPGSGNSRQGSIQQDPTPEPVGSAPSARETAPEDERVHQKDGSSSNDQSPANSSPPLGPKPAGSKVPAAGPGPTRPPLRADGLQPASIAPKPTQTQTHPPEKSFSVVDPSSKIETMSLLARPPSPDGLSNGLASGPEAARKTPH